MVWIPTSKNHKIKDQPEDGCSASKALCNIFLFLVLLPGSAGGRGSAQLPGEPLTPLPPGQLSSLHRVRQVSAPAPPPSKSRGCGAGPGKGGHLPLGLAGRSRGGVSEGCPGHSPPPPAPASVRVLCASHGDTPFWVVFLAGNP